LAEDGYQGSKVAETNKHLGMEVYDLCWLTGINQTKQLLAKT
jgi:hypothetical protein